ncbi:uncharacterized protein METZ01_LOCUS359965, partial [marine metagenome]
MDLEIPWSELSLLVPVPSFSDFCDTNFQDPEVPWYPDPYAPD